MQVGDNLVLDNSGTDGSGAVAQVSVVGGAIAPEAGDVAEYGMSLQQTISHLKKQVNHFIKTHMKEQRLFWKQAPLQTLVLHHNQMKLQMLEWSQRKWLCKTSNSFKYYNN